MNTGLPIITVQAKTLPAAWEEAVIKTWEQGLQIKTEYDKPGDPPSRDVTMVMIVEEPMAEPRIHRAFPGGLEDLEVYRQEVVNGIHDSWIKPEEGKWSYTYHQRIFSYEINGEKIDQMSYVIDKLKNKEFSRRAQAITWNPKLDPLTDEPPCLQRIWFRISRDGKGGAFLNMNTHWRSRDAYKAAFMNIFALVSLQSIIAETLTKQTGEKIGVGRYVDITDSFHIYGSYYKEFENFIEAVKKRSFEERTWDSEFAKSFFEEARAKIAKEQKA